VEGGRVDEDELSGDMRSRATGAARAKIGGWKRLLEKEGDMYIYIYIYNCNWALTRWQ
jgi:hypothetical protein